MRHNQNKHSTANHGNSQHEQPKHMEAQYGRNDMPGPQRPPKRSVLSRLRGKFQEKPATAEEVKQLGLNAKREVYKTAIQKAKSARPSRFSGFGGGGNSGPSYRKSSKFAQQDNSFLFGPSKAQGGGFLDSGNEPSFSFITGVEPQRGRGKKQESGFGKGLTDLF